MRKTMRNVILILLFLTLSASTAFLAYLHFSASDDRDLTGEWTASLDMTDQACAVAFGWLQDIEAVTVSLEDIRDHMQDLTVLVNLTLEQTARSEGTFRCNVLPESYEACRQAAYEAFAAAFRELLAERLCMAGYTGATGPEAIEALVTEAFGMSTVSYLMACGPALLPSLEELQAQYDGSGTYEAAEGILTRAYEAGGTVATKTERYIRQDFSLVLAGEAGTEASDSAAEDYPVIYTLAQTQD